LNRLSQIFFAGIRGIHYQGDIAIEMLTIGKGNCKGNALFSFLELV